MDKYLLVFYGGKMETDPQKVEKSVALWNKWYADLGKAVVDGGNPTGPGKVISEVGVNNAGANPVTGYSILQAKDIDTAVTMAKSCPILAAGGQVAVHPIMPMM
jgi:hypothetical protein